MNLQVDYHADLDVVVIEGIKYIVVDLLCCFAETRDWKQWLLGNPSPVCGTLGPNVPLD